MLIPEVAELVRAGLLHPYDSEWIGRLKPESQLAAAEKCQRPNPSFAATSYAKSKVSHGTPSIQARRKR